jgi:LAO/AO transport system kinase
MAVADMVDLFVLLVSPGGGDDLQGIKRGVMELADLVVVTKADGDLLKAVNRAASDYQGALHLMRPKYTGVSPEVLKVSSIEGTGIEQAWRAMQMLHASLAKAGYLKQLRADQARRWFWTEVQAALNEELIENKKLGEEARKLEAAIVTGKALPFAAARSLFRRIFAA